MSVNRVLMIELLHMRVRRMIRPFALFGVVVVVIAIGFIHRRRREARAEKVLPAARPIDGTSAVGIAADAPGYQTTTMRLRPGEGTP